jgi:hypothetical protein
MNHPRFFGYGSLVNLATHDYPDARPARVKGWRRVWRHTSLRPVAFLSAEPCDQTELFGVTASVPDGDWVALDAREHAYRRHVVTQQTDPAEHFVSLYAVDPAHHHTEGEKGPILLSYVDVVVQGYLRVFGQEGANGFFATTHHWDIPILDDRAAPVYPRHQRLTSSETETVDEALRRLGCRIVKSLA